jgi:hypothetical protein
MVDAEKVVQDIETAPKKVVKRQTPSEAGISAIRRAETELSQVLARYERPSEESVALMKAVDAALDALHAHLYNEARRERRR